jgi:hypothetical protein
LRIDRFQTRSNRGEFGRTFELQPRIYGHRP